MDERLHDTLHKLPTDLLKLRADLERIQTDIDELLMYVFRKEDGAPNTGNTTNKGGNK